MVWGLGFGVCGAVSLEAASTLSGCRGRGLDDVILEGPSSLEWGLECIVAEAYRDFDMTLRLGF